MINFRFHLVSLTAVLLALGMGLVLGTTFLDDALVETLRTQLDGLEGDLVHQREEVSERQSVLDELEAEHELLDEELGGHMLPGSLVGEPVLVVSRQGVDEELSGRVFDALDSAEADVVGEWVLGADLSLESDDAVERLGEALDMSTDDADRLRDNALTRLSDVLYGATDAAESADPDMQPLAGSLEPSAGGTDPGERHEPELLTGLREAGFVEYRFTDGSDATEVELPEGGLRVVVVDGPDAETPMSVLVQTLEELASAGPVPVVVSAPAPLEPEEEGEVAPLVAEVRENEALVARMSTVDNLERVPGKVATVLAADAAVPGSPHIGDYGQGADVERLLPPPEALESPDE